MPAECCFPLSKKIPVADAVLAEPLSIGVYTIELLQSLRDAPNHLALLGCGPIGLCVMTAARAAGIDAIYATEKLDYRLAAAMRLGARWTGNVEKTNVVADLLAQKPEGLEAVIDCCGDQQAFDQAIQLLKPGGLFLIVGIPASDRVSFDISLLRRKEITIQNVRRQNDCVEKAIALIESGEMPTGVLVTHEFELAEAQEAFEIVANYRDGVIKAVIRLD